MQAAFTHIHTLQEKRRNGQLKQRGIWNVKPLFSSKTITQLEKLFFCAIKYHIVQGGKVYSLSSQGRERDANQKGLTEKLSETHFKGVKYGPSLPLASLEV